MSSVDAISGLGLVGVELYRLSLRLSAPFRTSRGVLSQRDVLLVRVLSQETEGWGECAADPRPSYSSEYAHGAVDVLRRFLFPLLVNVGVLDAARVHAALAPIRGHNAAKAALEAAVLDAQLRHHRLSLATFLGGVRDRVPCGVSVGITDSVGGLLDEVAGHLEQGYRRIKLKIAPGWDIEPVRAVRRHFGDDLPLQVDANMAYSLADVRHLARLDAFGLLMIEQPLAADSLLGHAELARRLATPVCLDESIESLAQAAVAIRLGACSIVNIKPGRVGGYIEARRIHDLCQAHGVPVWCGGMLESGIGRAANIALASLPGFTMPGDISASQRYFDADITPAVQLEDGHLRVPAGGGIGVDPMPHRLREATKVEWLDAGAR